MSLTRKGLAATIAAAATAAVGMGAPGANAAVQSRIPGPDINRVDCAWANDPLVVFQSGYHNSDCFENAGWENVRIYNINDVYTGNNAVEFDINGTWCNDPHKNTWASSWCHFPSGTGATMTFLSIYPGI